MYIQIIKFDSWVPYAPVSWEWDTNVTTFSVVFVHKLLYNAGKNSVKVKEKKQIENKRKTGKAKR